MYMLRILLEKGYHLAKIILISLIKLGAEGFAQIHAESHGREAMAQI